MLVDENDQFFGSVTASELVAHTTDRGLDHPAMATARSADYAVSKSTNIVAALQSMAENEAEYLPVVEDSEEHGSVVLGVVFKSDLLAEHYDVVKRAREEEFGIT
jgi:CBS-domain-containing membrane protein